MTGDERVRHCALCSLNVYNFSEMTRDEIRELIVRTEGRVCGRLYRRADGTMLTRDCPTGLRALRRRASRAAAAMVAALLSLPAFAFGRSDDSKVKLTTEQASAPQAVVFTGVVLANDDSGVLPGVSVTLRDEATGKVVTTVTDRNGVFTFMSLSDGTYRAELALPGFQRASIEHLALKSSVVTHASIRLVIEPEMGIIVVEEQAPRHDALSTTFPQSFIDKLPM
jgi:hypothetical protein